MKNLLSENMMRFGTKNLTEAAKKELTLKSILETIDQYGLRTEVRKALAEAAIPEGAKVNVDSPSKGNITVPVPTDSATVGAARKIIGTIMKQTSGIDNNKAYVRSRYDICCWTKRTRTYRNYSRCRFARCYDFKTNRI
jgi:uncharacterized membrane protein